jgi:hypothetical protein
VAALIKAGATVKTDLLFVPQTKYKLEHGTSLDELNMDAYLAAHPAVGCTTDELLSHCHNPSTLTRWFKPEGGYGVLV